MIFHKAGKYNGDESSLPHKKHHPNAVPFKEFKNMKQLSLVANIGGAILIILLFIPFILLTKEFFLEQHCSVSMLIGCFCSCFSIVPHEILHAVCFKEDVYYYTNFKQGLAFVVGTEDMSKTRFVLMSLCPNIILGLIPYIIFLIFPHLVFLSVFGAICLGMGFGDYINVYNALTQMPQGSKTYICGMHSYWYLED